MVLYKSCTECKVKCCKTGPGPYKALEPHEYLDRFGTDDAYNTKCKMLTKSGKCMLWGTPKFPTECRTYVCQSRKFTKKELKTISNIVDTSDGWGCPKCKGNYVIVTGRYKYLCEICGHKFSWKRLPIVA